MLPVILKYHGNPKSVIVWNGAYRWPSQGGLGQAVPGLFSIVTAYSGTNTQSPIKTQLGKFIQKKTNTYACP